MKKKRFIKFAVLNKVYCVLFRLGFYKTCARIYPHLMKSLSGYTTEDGITVL